VIDAAEQNSARSVQEQTSIEDERGMEADFNLFFTQRQAAKKRSCNGSMDTGSHVHMMLEARRRPLSKRQDMVMPAV